MSVLVTGGLGYIGSHIVRVLQEQGDDVVIIDDYSEGVEARVAAAPITRLDLAARDSCSEIATVMRTSGVTSVVHLAARKRVDESLTRPLWYYSQNLGALWNVLAAMIEVGVRDIVFSSSAAVYGVTDGRAVTETTAASPVNPYGSSKLAGEMMLRAAAQAHELRATSLRYFNVGGAGWPDLGDTSTSNLIPMVFERIEAGLAPLIYGDDYDTADGTCVRDFVHVSDLAQAHVAALHYLQSGPHVEPVFNVGTGVGTSVRGVIAGVGAVASRLLIPEIGPRRVGDPASVVAAVERIQGVLGWKAQLGIQEIIGSAWTAREYARSGS